MEIKADHIDISIVIVNYKSWKHLYNCLTSLHFSFDNFSFEVIVIDNKSDDGKLSEFRENFSWVKFIENSGNNGFANGCNVGALASKGKYILFLNPDTIANEKVIYEMWNYAQKNYQVGVVSCMQKKSSGGYEKKYRRFPSLLTLFGLTRAVAKPFIKVPGYKEDGVLFTDWVSGSVVFISREWYDQIQGWNEDYWMYFEDIDLCKRIAHSNGQIVLLENFELIHNHGGASRINLATSSITKTQVLISKHVYIDNHFTGLEKYLSHLLLILNNLLFKTLLSLLGLFFFFLRKLRLEQLIFIKLIKYYVGAMRNRTWLSSNSTNFPKNC